MVKKSLIKNHSGVKRTNSSLGTELKEPAKLPITECPITFFKGWLATILEIVIKEFEEWKLLFVISNDYENQWVRGYCIDGKNNYCTSFVVTKVHAANATCPCLSLHCPLLWHSLSTHLLSIILRLPAQIYWPGRHLMPMLSDSICLWSGSLLSAVEYSDVISSTFTASRCQSLLIWGPTGWGATTT